MRLLYLHCISINVLDFISSCRSWYKNVAIFWSIFVFHEYQSFCRGKKAYQYKRQSWPTQGGSLKIEYLWKAFLEQRWNSCMNDIIPFDKSPPKILTWMVSLPIVIITSLIFDSELRSDDFWKRIIFIFEFILITLFLTLTESFSVTAK